MYKGLIDLSLKSDSEEDRDPPSLDCFRYEVGTTGELA